MTQASAITEPQVLATPEIDSSASVRAHDRRGLVPERESGVPEFEAGVPEFEVGVPELDTGWSAGRLLLARIAWTGVAVLVAALVVSTVPARYAAFLHTRGTGIPSGDYATYEIALFGVAVAIFESVAALLVWRSSGQKSKLAVQSLTTAGRSLKPVGRSLTLPSRSLKPASRSIAFLSALALVTFPIYASPQESFAHLATPWHWTGAGLAFVGVVALTLCFYIVPDGVYTPRWTCWLIVPWVLLQGAHQLISASACDYTTWPGLLTVLAVASGLGPAIGVMLYRHRYVLTPLQRQQIRWPMWGVMLAVGMVLTIEVVVKLLPHSLDQNLLVGAAADTGRVGAVLLVPLAIAVAIARYRLWAIELFIHRTLVYGMLTASVIGFYVLLVGALDTLLSGHGGVFISLVATGLVALLFQPLRERLQRAVNRLLYGERDDPYHVLSHLGRQLEQTLAPDAVLPAVVETVARTLKLPYVAVALPRHSGSPNPACQTIVVAAHGTPISEPLVLPLLYQQEPVGQLLVAPRTGSDSLSAADHRLFTDLTRQVAIAVHATELTAEAVRLTAALQQARSRLVTLREGERRRLRQDLHDGLGPALASVTLQAETARDLLQSDPAQADAILADITAQAHATIADIRRVVYDLRPPALDDLGLVDAARAHANRLNGQDLTMTVDAPEEIVSLPAAVEVAAYRIIQEALTNVVRHAVARTCTIRLRIGASAFGSALFVDVTDDGQGLPTTWRAGVGLQSMRARAAELCGSCVIEARTGSDGGTRVSATLPLECPQSDDPLEEGR